MSPRQNRAIWIRIAAAATLIYCAAVIALKVTGTY